MSEEIRRTACPDCAPDRGRRKFLIGAGTAAVAAATGGLTVFTRTAVADALPAGTKVAAPEMTVARLYESLSADQKTKVVRPFDHPDATKVSANWHIVPHTVGDFTPDQQRMIHEILLGATNDDGYDLFMRQMKDDHGGIEKYSVAIFGEPGQGKYEWVMTGRHLTMRVDGNNIPDAVFGGPLAYGHGVESSPKANLFYPQTQAVNEIFKALDEKQREKALLAQAPGENQIAVKKAGFAGIPIAEMTKDQQAVVAKAMKELMSPYRPSDVKEAVDAVRANGGYDQIHFSFYKTGDLLNDSEWDIWRIEGPTFTWHFRGAPHVHAYLNFRTKPAA